MAISDEEYLGRNELRELRIGLTAPRDYAGAARHFIKDFSITSWLLRQEQRRRFRN
jgi:hypothetical protein